LLSPTRETSNTVLTRVRTTPDIYEPFLLSQGIRLGDVLFISGQAGYGDDGKIVDGGFRAQGEQAFSNLQRALEAGDSNLGHVAKVTIFVTDRRDTKAMTPTGHSGRPSPPDLRTSSAIVFLDSILQGLPVSNCRRVDDASKEKL
jgi:enamine deaminase RidA (YjgF/YER057c/UK114 family)